MKHPFKNLSLTGLVIIGVVFALTLVCLFIAQPKEAAAGSLATGLMAFGLFGVTGVAQDSIVKLRTVKYTHAAAAVAAGDIIVAGNRVLQCVTAAAINTETTYIYRGKVSWPKEAALAISVLDQIFWDVANSKVTTTQAGGIPIGICAEKALAADTEVTILLLQPSAFLDAASAKTRAVIALADAAATLTATQLVDSGIFTITPTAGRALTTATAAQIVAQIKGARVGSTFEFTVVCLAAFAATITAGAGVTLVGNMAPNNASATFIVRLDNVTSGAEAVTIYRA